MSFRLLVALLLALAANSEQFDMTDIVARISQQKYASIDRTQPGFEVASENDTYPLQENHSFAHLQLDEDEVLMQLEDEVLMLSELLRQEQEQRGADVWRVQMQGEADAGRSPVDPSIEQEQEQREAEVQLQMQRDAEAYFRQKQDQEQREAEANMLLEGEDTPFLSGLEAARLHLKTRSESLANEVRNLHEAVSRSSAVSGKPSTPLLSKGALREMPSTEDDCAGNPDCLRVREEMATAVPAGTSVDTEDECAGNPDCLRVREEMAAAVPKSSSGGFLNRFGSLLSR